jgi:hypothetical protein
MAAPAQKTIRNAITSNIVCLANLALFHHLHDPSDATAELKSGPGHAVAVEALVAGECRVTQTVRRLAIDEAGAECALRELVLLQIHWIGSNG